MTRHVVTVIAAGLLAAAPAFAQSEVPPATTSGQTGTVTKGGQSLGQKDLQTAENFARGSLDEVQTGRLAMQKAQSPAVNEFGRWMVTDHTLAGHLLDASLAGTGFTAPKSVDAEGQKAESKLRGLSGSQFDQQYIAMMVQDHTKDLAEFRQASTTVINPGLRNFATQMVPVLEEHLAAAKALQSGGGAEANTAGR